MRPADNARSATIAGRLLVSPHAVFDRSHLLILIFAVVGAAAGVWLGGWLRPSAPLPPVRSAAPALALGAQRPHTRLPDLDGRIQSLSDWDGKLVLLNFWASWCAPCREEMPLLDRTQQRLAANGLQVIGIAVDSADATRAFLADFPVAYPILVDDPDSGGDVSTRFGDNRGVLPYTVLIGRDGRILAQRFGNFSESGLQAWLQPHL